MDYWNGNCAPRAPKARDILRPSAALRFSRESRRPRQFSGYRFASSPGRGTGDWARNCLRLAPRVLAARRCAIAGSAPSFANHDSAQRRLWVLARAAMARSLRDAAGISNRDLTFYASLTWAIA